jgi:hypothetical protein
MELSSCLVKMGRFTKKGVQGRDDFQADEHPLNEDALPLPWLRCNSDTYMSVSNTPMPLTVLLLASGHHAYIKDGARGDTEVVSRRKELLVIQRGL